MKREKVRYTDTEILDWWINHPSAHVVGDYRDPEKTGKSLDHSGTGVRYAVYDPQIKTPWYPTARQALAQAVFSDMVKHDY